MANPIITLHPWEYARAFEVGIARFVANWGNQDAAHYDRSRMEEDRSAQPAAAACEIAVARYTNRYWHGHVWHRSEHGKYKKIADVGDDTEVRRVRTADGVAVRRSDAGRIVWCAKTVDSEYRKVELLGFVSADEVIPSIPGDQTWTRYPIASLDRPWDETDPLFEQLTQGYDEHAR